MQTLFNGSSPQATALIRALWTAVITGAIIAVGILQKDGTTEDAVYGFLAAALPILVIRGGAEGQGDQHRDNNGEVLPGDVTPNAPKP